MLWTRNHVFILMGQPDSSIVGPSVFKGTPYVKLKTSEYVELPYIWFVDRIESAKRKIKSNDSTVGMCHGIFIIISNFEWV